MQPEPPKPNLHLLIIPTFSPDLRFAHRHLRWKASTATYTADYATRRETRSQRRTGGAKAADRLVFSKTSP